MEAEFKLFKLRPAARFVLSACIYASGVAVQLLSGSYWLGFPLIALAALPLALKRITNKPDDQGFEEWRPVTMAEVDRLADTLAQSRKIKRKVSAGALPALAFVAACIAWVVAAINDRRDFMWLFGDAIFMLVPAVFFGNITVFLPVELDMKMDAFKALTTSDWPQSVAIAPYLRFDKDKAGKEIPEDVRVMLELKRAPADLVGIQFQVAINKGPNGNVPYMYAVVLTRGKDGPTHKTARRVNASGFIVEEGGDDNYGTVVLRQDTEIDAGYHTDPGDCARLRELALKVLELVGGKAA